MIKNLIPGLPERGKIKIGKKGQMTESRGGAKFRQPEKLDHFIVTTLERDPDTDNFILDKAIHGKIGPEPKRIPILLLYDDIDLNFMTRYACYSGRTCICSGDGEKADRPGKGGKAETVPCPCGAADPAYVPVKGQSPKCKMNGVFQCLIRDSEDIGGVHKFRTTSYNTVRGIMSTLQFMRTLTKGRLAGLPFDLVITPKTATAPSGGGVKIFVVGIAFAGSLTDLYMKSQQLQLNDAKYGYNIKHLEDHAKKLLTFDDRDINEIVEEFYPEQAEKEKPKIIPDEDVTAEKTATAPEVEKPPEPQAGSKGPGTHPPAPSTEKQDPPKRQRRKNQQAPAPDKTKDAPPIEDPDRTKPVKQEPPKKEAEKPENQEKIQQDLNDVF